jgi:hypothetical protein
MSECGKTQSVAWAAGQMKVLRRYLVNAIFAKTRAAAVETNPVS